MKKSTSRTAPAHAPRPSGNTTAVARAAEIAKWRARVPLEGEAKSAGNNVWLRSVYNPLRDNR